MQLNLFDIMVNTSASTELDEKAQEILDNRRDRYESRRQRRLDNAHHQGLKNRKLSKSFFDILPSLKA
jgi:hypothetical protein